MHVKCPAQGLAYSRYLEISSHNCFHYSWVKKNNKTKKKPSWVHSSRSLGLSLFFTGEAILWLLTLRHGQICILPYLKQEPTKCKSERGRGLTPRMRKGWASWEKTWKQILSIYTLDPCVAVHKQNWCVELKFKGIGIWALNSINTYFSRSHYLLLIKFHFGNCKTSPGLNYPSPAEMWNLFSLLPMVTASMNLVGHMNTQDKDYISQTPLQLVMSMWPHWVLLDVS